MQIAGLQKNSTVDFPGKLAAVIFTPGCNYRCYYCHNRHILERPPLMDEEAVSAYLEKRRGLIEGVVFSGGEPTLQRDLSWWMNRVKKLGYDVKLDTNGSDPGILCGLLSAGLADYVAMDFKAPFPLYPKICGAAATGVLRSMEALFASGVPHEFRTTLVPQLTLIELTQMAKALPPGSRWALQLYRPQPGDEAAWEGRSPYTPEQVKELAKAVSPLAPGAFARC